MRIRKMAAEPKPFKQTVKSNAKRWTKTEKKRGNIGNKGACRERGTGNRVPTWGTRSKVDSKNLEAKIPNDDLSSKTNPRVKFEKNFRRATFGLQEITRLTMRKTAATTKSEESVKSIVDNLELRSRRDTGSKKRHSDEFNSRMLCSERFSRMS
jgi:hypothetical protein